MQINVKDVINQYNNIHSLNEKSSEIYRLVTSFRNRYIAPTGMRRVVTKSKENELQDDRLLLKIGDASGSFRSQAKNEKEEIKKKLVIPDEHGREKELVDSSNMQSRVRAVLEREDVNPNTNMIVKASFANKFAHKIDKILKDEYGMSEDETSYLVIEELETIRSHFPVSPQKYIPGNLNTEYLKKIKVEELLKLFALLQESKSFDMQGRSNQSFLKRNIKFLLRTPVNLGNSEAIENALQELRGDLPFISNRINVSLQEEIAKAEENVGRLKLARTHMYAMKDYFMRQIVIEKHNPQIENSELKKMQIQFVRAQSDDQAVDKMIAIDYLPLAYYTELHMLTKAYESYAQEYDIELLEKEDSISSSRVGAPAVYLRKKEEALQILNALNEGKVAEVGIEKARILSRGEIPVLGFGEGSGGHGATEIDENGEPLKDNDNKEREDNMGKSPNNFDRTNDMSSDAERLLAEMDKLDNAQMLLAEKFVALQFPDSVELIANQFAKTDESIAVRPDFKYRILKNALMAVTQNKATDEYCNFCQRYLSKSDTEFSDKLDALIGKDPKSSSIRTLAYLTYDLIRDEIPNVKSQSELVALLGEETEKLTNADISHLRLLASELEKEQRHELDFAEIDNSNDEVKDFGFIEKELGVLKDFEKMSNNKSDIKFETGDIIPSISSKPKKKKSYDGPDDYDDYSGR